MCIGAQQVELLESLDEGFCDEVLEAATTYTPAATSSRQLQSKAVVIEMGRGDAGRCESIVRDRSLRVKLVPLLAPSSYSPSILHNNLPFQSVQLTSSLFWSNETKEISTCSDVY
jgi:hypothetical protein